MAEAVDFLTDRGRRLFKGQGQLWLCTRRARAVLSPGAWTL